jgi:hypothetical protein
LFAHYIGIDYSGAATPTCSLKGLRVYSAGRRALPIEVHPPPSSPRKYWTRRGIAEWLVERLMEDVPTLVEIDHGFSFPLRYFEVHHLLPDWQNFLKVQFWPFDGWEIPYDRSAVVEIYPSLWNRNYPRKDRTADQHDAYTAASWLKETDCNGLMTKFLNPSLSPDERAVAQVEGWILGVM